MSADVIEIADHRKPDSAGNGAWEALFDLFTAGKADCPNCCATHLLADLWIRGFKVVPLEPGGDQPDAA